MAAALVVGCAGGDPAPARPAAQPAPVEAVPARAGSLPLVERVGGVVKARNQVAIRPEIEATVVEVTVRTGDAVERGQILVRLDAGRLREQVRLAEAAVAEARARAAETDAQAGRVRALAAEDLVSDTERDAQEAQRAQAAARLEQALATVEERRAALARAVVRAPMAGNVGRRNAEVGMLADTGTTLFLIGELSELIVEVPLTERMLGHVRDGTEARIVAPALGGKPIVARMSRISPFLEADSFSTTGEIDVDNREGRLRPGMFVTVDLLHGAGDAATLVPTSALAEDPASGRRGVFVVVDAEGLVEPDTPGGELPEATRRAEFRPVEVLAEGRGILGISGAAAGEWVITVGHHLLLQTLAVEGDDVELAARVRPTSWDRVLELQGLQREDLLAGLLAKQQRIAEALGPEIPESEAVVEGILRGEAATPPGETTAGN